MTEKYKIVRINSSYGESYKIDGIVLHGVLENLFDTNNESSTENIRKEVIEAKKHFKNTDGLLLMLRENQLKRRRHL